MTDRADRKFRAIGRGAKTQRCWDHAPPYALSTQPSAPTHPSQIPRERPLRPLPRSPSFHRLANMDAAAITFNLAIRRVLPFNVLSPAEQQDPRSTSVALHFMHYNFVKIHSTLRTTPAQTAGVTDRLWGGHPNMTGFLSPYGALYRATQRAVGIKEGDRTKKAKGKTTKTRRANVESRGHRVSKALRDAPSASTDAADTLPAQTQGGQT